MLIITQLVGFRSSSCNHIIGMKLQGLPPEAVVNIEVGTSQGFMVIKVLAKRFHRARRCCFEKSGIVMVCRHDPGIDLLVLFIIGAQCANHIIGRKQATLRCI